MTVPESSVAKFFKVSVWMWPWLSPISLKGLLSSKLPSSHHCTLPGALPDSWQEKVAHSPTKTSVVLRSHTMKTSFTVEKYTYAYTERIICLSIISTQHSHIYKTDKHHANIKVYKGLVLLKPTILCVRINCRMQLKCN